MHIYCQTSQKPGIFGEESAQAVERSLYASLRNQKIILIMKKILMTNISDVSNNLR